MWYIGTFNDAGFVKELLMIAILLISQINNEVIFGGFFLLPYDKKNEL
jgi:hypothetical protein